MKRINNIVRLFVLSLSLSILFPSCDIGLGEAVDLQGPEIELTSHKDNDTVATAFTLSGTATDNEAVTKIAIDFEEANLHYMVIPGEEWKSKDASGNWQTADKGTCVLEGSVWKWSLAVDCSAYISSLKESDRKSVKLTAIASDQAGNSGKKSKIDCTLVVDPSNPVVSVYKPELLTGDFKSVYTKAENYQLQDGNILSLLLNGNLTLKGRQSEAVSFKSLRIQFDSFAYDSNITVYDKGTTANPKYTTSSPVSSIAEIDALEESSIEDSVSSNIYFAKTIESSDLREWELTVTPDQWATNDAGISKGLNTGKHIIRVVTTSLTTSNKWEKKIVGYFIWWPEADRPWVTSAAGDDVETPYATECYPGSNFSGSAQDDDEIKSLVSTMYKKVGDDYVQYVAEGYTNPVIHPLSSDTPKYSAWSVIVPQENGNYKLVTTVKDDSNEMSLTKYFKTSDVTAPRITIESPLDNTSAILNEAGNLTFKLNATDNSKVASLAMVWLNPAKKTDPNNKIQYLTGESTEWNNATASGYEDASGNKLYLLGSNSANISIEKTFNLYSDFGIDGSSKTLSSQDFLFRAVDDSDKKSVKSITLTGDGITPVVEFTSIKIGEDTKNFVNGITPTAFKKITDGASATITGTWNDYFTSTLANTSKLKKLQLTWGSYSSETTVNPDGTWTAVIQAPSSGGTITASLSDFGGNTKTVQAAASIETSDLMLTRVGCNEDDGAYSTGKTLNITLEFSKNTKVSGGTPTLTLNNGGTATYYSGSDSTSHVYKYVVNTTDQDVAKLTVTQINPNGATWTDSAAESSSLSLSKDSIPLRGNLGDTRTITIDKTFPRVNKITSLTYAGSYKADSSILLMLEFTEDVTITNSNNLAVLFKHKKSGNDVKASSPTVTGSKYVLFTYKVADGENASPLEFDSIINTGVTVKDNAGNSLSEWTPDTTPDFTGIIIDTTKPVAPKIMDGTNTTSIWNPGSLIFGEGTSFTLDNNGTTDSQSMEYSLDNGTNWTPYTSKVSLTNNGTYNVTARQTDKAGNVSDSTAVKTVTLDKGDLLTRVTATTSNGTYSTNTSTDTITGKIVFRKYVTIESGATVTLNVGNRKTNAMTTTCSINECKNADASGSEFTFTYTISDGDYVTDSDGLLDVTGWSFNSVTVTEHNIPASVANPSIDSDKRFKKNREIKIVTGLPSIISNGVSFTGIGSAAVLSVTYDRDISKLSGNIVFEYDVKTGNEFHVPAVLSANEYNELKSNSIITSSYEAGTNGATKSGSTLVNDTTTKYILKTNVSDTNADLVKVFTDAGKHKVTIPVVSDQVSIENEKTLKVDLGSSYALPVKGAVYKLTIPAGAVTDAVSNKNIVYDGSVTSAGVEAPDIRIVKPSYTITGPNASTPTADCTVDASVNMNDVKTATMYLSCRTPGAAISYGMNSKISANVIVHSNPINVSTTKTADVTVPTTYGNTYSAEVSLGSSNAVNEFDNAFGLKIAIAAKASKSGVDSSISYEYAARTVVKLHIHGYRDGNGQDKTDYDLNLNMCDLRVWLCGGDSTAGPNSSSEFPLAWSDSSKFKMMAGGHTNETEYLKYRSMFGKWWLVSWDVTSTTYIGFVIGNVRGDSNTKGPSFWYLGDYLWALIKEKYPLYPGETLLMETTDGTSAYNNGEATATPYGANFAFNKTKGVKDR